MNNEIDFKKGKEQEHIKLVKEFFLESIKSEGDKKSQYFGKALGCLWSINDNRSGFSKFFKSSKTGLGPVVKKIKEFVNSEEGTSGEVFLDLLKVLIKSSSIDKGILGKSKVLEAVREINKSFQSAQNDSNMTKSKKKSVWDELIPEWDNDKTAVEKLKELSPQDLMLDQVKTSIINTHSPINKKIGQPVKNENKKELKKESESRESIDIDVYEAVRQKIYVEGIKIVQESEGIRERARKDTSLTVAADYDADRQWFEEKLQILKNKWSKHYITKHLSDAGKQRGLILGLYCALGEVLVEWSKCHKNDSWPPFDHCVKKLYEFVFDNRVVSKIEALRATATDQRLQSLDEVTNIFSKVKRVLEGDDN